MTVTRLISISFFCPCSMAVFVRLLFFCFVTVLSRAQLDTCVYSREDIFPCYYRSNILRAGPNEYSIHFTRFSRRRCQVRSQGQCVGPISDLATDEMRVLFSPEFDSGMPYLPNQRVEYKVQCAPNEMAFYNITFLDLPQEDCPVNGILRCRDYVQIIQPPFGVVEECGTTPFGPSITENNFTVVFRTGAGINDYGMGFQMYVTCFRPWEANLPGCRDISAVNCSRTCACHLLPIPIFYSDIFPNSGYPKYEPMPDDLAQFHHRWSRFKGQPGFVVQELDIAYNYTVEYNQSTITVTDSYGAIIASYSKVHILETINGCGDIERHAGSFEQIGTLILHEGGLLRILKTNAYLQLFWTAQAQPTEILYNEYKNELILMTKPLLNFALANATLQSLGTSPVFPSQSRLPQEDACNMFDDGDRDAVLAALRRENSCDPILRAQSRATLKFYVDFVSKDCVEYLRTTDISCSK